MKNDFHFPAFWRAGPKMAFRPQRQEVHSWSFATEAAHAACRSGEGG